MDPDTALAEARQEAAAVTRLIDEGLNGSETPDFDALVTAADALAERFIALDQWLTKGGRPPRVWDGPAAIVPQPLCPFRQHDRVQVVKPGLWVMIDRSQCYLPAGTLATVTKADHRSFTIHLDAWWPVLDEWGNTVSWDVEEILDNPECYPDGGWATILESFTNLTWEG